MSLSRGRSIRIDTGLLKIFIVLFQIADIHSAYGDDCCLDVHIFRSAFAVMSVGFTHSCRADLRFRLFIVPHKIPRTGHRE